MTRDRIRKGSVSLIAILLIVILMALPTGYEDAAIYKGTDRVRAKVLSTDESSVINNGLIQSGEQYCKVKILGGKFKGEETKAVNMLSGSLEADKIFQEGDIAQVVISYSNGEILSVMMSDHYRLDKELLLAGIFVLLLIGFAGRTGLRAVYSFMITILAIWKILTPAYLKGANPIWWGIAAWPVDGFVEANDFTGKAVIPFCTAASSGIGDSGNLLEEMAGTGNWLEGKRLDRGISEDEVKDWISDLGISSVEN